jgi:4-carboxymuconolactone decarboxylase
MTKKKARLPQHYTNIRSNYPRLAAALEGLGKAVREEGPLDAKTAHLVQLAAAAGVHSEGAVHSHVRRALEAGATPPEIRHALVLCVSTLGFPTVAAALSWANDVLPRA